jgi:hypothetical protein
MTAHHSDFSDGDAERDGLNLTLKKGNPRNRSKTNLLLANRQAKNQRSSLPDRNNHVSLNRDVLSNRKAGNPVAINKGSSKNSKALAPNRGSATHLGGRDETKNRPRAVNPNVLAMVDLAEGVNNHAKIKTVVAISGRPVARTSVNRNPHQPSPVLVDVCGLSP